MTERPHRITVHSGSQQRTQHTILLPTEVDSIFRLPPQRCIFILNDVVTSVACQLDQQTGLGVEIETAKGMPDQGPVSDGVWLHIPEVTAVFGSIPAGGRIVR